MMVGEIAKKRVNPSFVLTRTSTEVWSLDKFKASRPVFG